MSNKKTVILTADVKEDLDKLKEQIESFHGVKVTLSTIVKGLLQDHRALVNYSAQSEENLKAFRDIEKSCDYDLDLPLAGRIKDYLARSKVSDSLDE